MCPHCGASNRVDAEKSKENFKYLAFFSLILAMFSIGILGGGGANNPALYTVWRWSLYACLTYGFYCLYHADWSMLDGEDVSPSDKPPPTVPKE